MATHWLPGILKAFQEDYPNIDFELLLGDYTEIESWIAEGRVDCGFTRLPASSALETIFLKTMNIWSFFLKDMPYQNMT